VEEAAAVAALPADLSCAHNGQTKRSDSHEILHPRPIPTESAQGEGSFFLELEAAKLAALAEFAAGAGHEINNPLATIVGRVQTLLAGERDPTRRQNLATIAAQAFRIRDMIGDLMVIARPPAPVVERLILNEAVQAIVERFQDAALERSGSLTFDADTTVFATADPTQLAIVVSELVRNSLGAIAPSNGKIRVSVASALRDGRRCAVLVVADNGRGLSESDRAHLFDPFYSGRDAGRGLGFGLCKCWRIVTNHGGSIDVDSTPGSGATFRVYWPSSEESAARATEDAP
jgi:signal transduction histidine kinase